jgi:hypothetical protein
MRRVLMARAVTPVRDLTDPAAPVRNDVSEIVRRTIRLVSPEDRPPPTGQISGYVVTVDGLRQRGVAIELGELVTQTDDDGRFLLRDVPPGKHVVKASRGLRTGELEVDVVAGQATSEVEIAIAR